MCKDKFNGDKGSQFSKCEGFGHIKAQCPNFLKKHKKGLTATWSVSESEEETTNIRMDYFDRSEYDGESSTKEENLDSYRLLVVKWKEM